MSTKTIELNQAVRDVLIASRTSELAKQEDLKAAHGALWSAIYVAFPETDPEAENNIKYDKESGEITLNGEHALPEKVSDLAVKLATKRYASKRADHVRQGKMWHKIKSEYPDIGLEAVDAEIDVEWQESEEVVLLTATLTITITG